MRKKDLPVIVFTGLYLVIFTILGFSTKNYEFLFYVGIVLLAGLLIWLRHRHIPFTRDLLWGLSIWGLLHMLGGNINIGNDQILYELQLIPNYLCYDQLVHFFGFGMATLLGYLLLEPSLKAKPKWTSLSILIVMIGAGFGALNEVIEFIATLNFPDNKVGDYRNNALDLVFNLLGALTATLYIRFKYKK